MHEVALLRRSCSKNYHYLIFLTWWTLIKKLMTKHIGCGGNIPIKQPFLRDFREKYFFRNLKLGLKITEATEKEIKTSVSG